MNLSNTRSLPCCTINRRQYCHINLDYNWEHIKKTGYYCRLKHRSYLWPARIKNNHTLISDSICKYTNRLHETYVQAFPGARIYTLLQKIRLGKIRITGYKIVILHVGTNDLQELSVEDLVHRMKQLVQTVRQKNSSAAIVVSQILHRPRDTETEDKKRVAVNKALQKLTNELRPNCYSWYTWRVTQNKDKSVNLNLFAKDKLHLNFQGISKIRMFIEHNIVTLKGFLKSR